MKDQCEDPSAHLKVLERAIREGDNPVEDRGRGRTGILSTTDPGEFVGSRGDHPPRLKTFSDR